MSPVSRTVATARWLDVLLDRLLETACSMTGARYAALGILDPGRRELERFITRGQLSQPHAASGAATQGCVITSNDAA